MRIAQVAPLFESVPPARYGGTERIVSWLTEALVAAGHDVTLFASGDSQTSAHLVPCCPHALRAAGVEDEVTPHVFEIERALDPRWRFDVIHFHTGTMHFPGAARRATAPTLTTMHGRLDRDEVRALMRLFPDLTLAAISREQREQAPWAHWAGVVPHGMPLDLFEPGYGGGGAAFLGRISREKRPDRAVAIARGARMPLTIAAKVGAADRGYYEREVRPLLGDDVEFIGEIDDDEKQALLGASSALLFPIDWPEPFGIAMIESLACGTPVIGWNTGSVPSVVEDGVTGFVVDNIDDAIVALDNASMLSRDACRSAFESRFSVGRMTADYLKIYHRLLEHGERRRSP